MYGDIGNQPDAAYHPIINDDGTAVPMHGLVQCTGVYVGDSQSEGKGSALVRRPGVDSDGALLVNCNPCNPGDRGSAHNVFPCVVAYQSDDEDSVDPLPGEIWGPKSGSWYLHRGYRGFKIIGGAGLGFVNVMREESFDDAIPVTLWTKTQVSGQWLYSNSYGHFQVPESQVDASTNPTSNADGKIPVDIQTVQTQTEDGYFPDIWTITITGVTGGTFTLTEDGGVPTTDIPWNASAGTINGLLSIFAVTITDNADQSIRKLKFTSNDGTAPHTITLQSSLKPGVPNKPAVFRNNTPMAVPVKAWVKRGTGAAPIVTPKITRAGDGNNYAQILLTVANVRDGTFDVGFGAKSTVDWNVSPSDLQTSLSATVACTVTGTAATSGTDGEYTIDVTADKLPHRLSVEYSDLVGTEFVVVVWSNGTLCTGPFGGVDPTYLPGYLPLAAPTLTVSKIATGDNVSVSDEWTVRIAGADQTLGSQGRLIFDKGGMTPISRVVEASGGLSDWHVVMTGGETFTTAVDLSGGQRGTRFTIFTITANDFAPGHTLNVYIAPLVGFIPHQVVYLSGDTGCASLNPPTDS